MKLLLLRSGIKEDRYNKLLDELSNLNDDLYGRVLEIYETEWKEAYTVWKQVSISDPSKAEEIWARWEALDIENTYEQRLLNTKLIDLRKAFTKVLNTWLKRKR